MKKFILFISLFILVFGCLARPAAVHAVESLDVPEAKTAPIEQDSGYTDENGKAISVDDYNRSRAQAKEGALQKYPAVFVIAGIVIVGGAGVLIYKKTKK